MSMSTPERPDGCDWDLGMSYSHRDIPCTVNDLLQCRLLGRVSVQNFKSIRYCKSLALGVTFSFSQKGGVLARNVFLTCMLSSVHDFIAFFQSGSYFSKRDET
jgi:hypothetical protein